MVFPKNLLTHMRDYQKNAFFWMLRLNTMNLGGLLADDMGLGKTLMVLSFLAKLKELKGVFVSLVVAPTSVLDVWDNEVSKHILNMRAFIWRGTERHHTSFQIGKIDLLVTSYSILKRDGNSLLYRMHFRYLIIDEAQYVKNPSTDNWKSVRSINAGQRIAISGTPIENSINDLWSILEVLNPYLLGDKFFFNKYYALEIKKNNLKRLNELNNRIGHIVLRRKKKDVEQKLPDKIISILKCDMSLEQGLFYKDIVFSINQNKFHKDDGLKIYLLSVLTKLRQVCCEPKLLLSNNRKYQYLHSSKILLLMKVLGNCLNIGRKIIIYSQFIKMQRIILDMIKKMGIVNTLWLHGGTKNRSIIIDAFQKNDKYRIIVISLKASGVGVTLTSANTVIYYDPWWNPAVEDQASDRVHRIGQLKTVHIIKLVCRDSIEEQIVELTNKKRRSAYGVLNSDLLKNDLSEFDMEELISFEINRLQNI